jgi:hypothetical protein
VTPQTVRNWIAGQRLAGWKQGNAWVVDAASLEECAATRPAAAPPGSNPADVEEQLRELTAAVDRLAARESDSALLLEAIRRERDRFRAEAASAKAAALRVNAAARETDKAVRQLLDVMEAQADALTQLLAPSTAADLMDNYGESPG